MQPSGFNDTEEAVAIALAQGHPPALIAHDLGVKLTTVNSRISGICKKLGLVGGKQNLAGLRAVLRQRYYA